MLPFSLMGGSAVICAILMYWLPETAHMKTMETLQDQFEGKKNYEVAYDEPEEEAKIVV